MKTKSFGKAKRRMSAFDTSQRASGLPTIAGRKKALSRVDRKKRPAKYKKLKNKLAELRAKRTGYRESKPKRTYY